MQPISTLYHRAVREAPPCIRCILFLLFVSLSNFLNAQVQKGQLHLGGQFSFDNYHSPTHNNFSATLQSQLGVMLSPKWSIGLGVPLTYSASSSNQTQSSVGLAPFVRRYFDLKAGFYAIAHAQVGAQFDLSSKRTIWTAQVTPAVSYFLNPRFALEAGFGGLTYTRHQEQESFYSTRVLEFRTNPIFSLRYYFPGNSSN